MTHARRRMSTDLDTRARRSERWRRRTDRCLARDRRGLTPGGWVICPAMEANALDHVALWVADRDPLADFPYAHLGMHEIERTDDFTLVGSDARRGKLTLFAAEGPRDPGALERVVLRVRDLDEALAPLPGGLAVDRPRRGLATFEAPEGLGIGSGRGARHRRRLRHRPRRAARPRPGRAPRASRRSASSPTTGRLRVGDKWMVLERGDAARRRAPAAEPHRAAGRLRAGAARRGERRGIEIAEVRDAANTFAFFVWGPDGIQLEYVEHKPGFALI